MLLRFINKSWPLLLIIIVIVVFFAKLFFPPSIFVTPDFAHSDLTNFNLPMKKIMQESLKNGQIPLWESRIGQGYPIIDEGQIGFFYPPNLLLFATLPFWLAFNIGYLITFLIASFGTYFLARSLNISKVGAYLAAITYSFSPLLVLHIHHYNLIQAASLFPWLMWSATMFFKSNRLIFLPIMSFIIAMQIFTGFPQLTAYSLIALVLFFLFKLMHLKRSLFQKTKIIVLITCFVLLGVLVGSVQIIASYKLTKEAKRTNSVTPKTILTDFPYKPTNVLTIFDPYRDGNPKFGTYKIFEQDKWGIFWENTTYFGLVQLVLASAFILSLFSRKKKNQIDIIVFWAGLATLGVILALGSSSPFHPIFSLPPFSLFRVPSRFLIFLFLAAAILAGIALSKFSFHKHKKIKIAFLTIIVSIATLDIFRVWSGYHMIGSVKTWLNTPQIARNIDNSGRLYSYGMGEKWNAIFLKSGWNNKEENYNFFRNFTSENSNVLVNVPHQNVYAGMISRRESIVSTLSQGSITKKGESLIIGKVSQNILDANNVAFLTTGTPLESQMWNLTDTAAFENQKIFLYKNTRNAPHAFVVTNYEIATSVQKVYEILNKDDFDPQKTAILEKEIPFVKKQTNSIGSVQIQKYENTQVHIATQITEDALVILSDSFYPGWKAYVNGKETEIYPANVNSRAVIVPKGDNIIVFKYERNDIKVGAVVSISALAQSALIALRLRKSKLN